MCIRDRGQLVRVGDPVGGDAGSLIATEFGGQIDPAGARGEHLDRQCEMSANSPALDPVAMRHQDIGLQDRGFVQHHIKRGDGNAQLPRTRPLELVVQPQDCLLYTSRCV